MQVEDQRGDLDSFVSERLAYEPGEIGQYFAAEQVDALALAIQQMEAGKAFIIGDMTGTGKGRVNAGIMRYAMVKGLTPVFVTEKPTLFSDIIRDLNDIGIQKYLGDRDINPFMTNAGAEVPVDQAALDWMEDARLAREAGEKQPKRVGKFIRRQTPKVVNERIAEISQNGLGDFDMVMTTYDQLSTVNGQESPRRNFMRAIIRNAIIALDESHNAFGQGEQGWKKADAPPNRAELVRQLADSAKGVFFSSATYAKRPDGLDLYARTDLGEAVDDPKMLGEVIAKGGVPMQQVVASMAG